MVINQQAHIDSRAWGCHSNYTVLHRDFQSGNGGGFNCKLYRSQLLTYWIETFSVALSKYWPGIV